MRPFGPRLARGLPLSLRVRRFFGAAAVAVAVAIASSYAGLALRKRAMRRFGQTATGFVEDAALVAGGFAIVNLARD